ncbi:cyclin-like protein [Lineolata rhizophorae]|uniref:Cyclin-like protein n=1 Tax=Lineolata rhizophorae TaxID=578093 RepID=A0A6A6NYX8_9PEZI|nr:cyclin-like protein [Lineolata rhizophorae]
MLGLSNAATVVSVDLADRMTTVGSLAGRSPLSAAAACIYMASHVMAEPKSPKEIAEPAGVSDGTIRTAYKYLYAAREEILTEEYVRNKGLNLAKLPSA